MREIKFRALVIFSELYGYHGMSDSRLAGVNEFEKLIEVRDISLNNGKVDYLTDYEGNEYSFADENLKEVIQYTGLKDKNGVEIYEGDIISFTDAYCDSNEDGQSFEEFENKGAIEYSSEDLRFYVTNKQSIDDEEILRNEVEVIGNIHENPELLEGGQ
ncbi:YopX family protein [Bacillus sp. mrc49]|uniref:YopX family protein n=1 Tax=Bacillus sp. mrc49 TaxID=2054913 RepID=UPI0012FE4DA1|nr:YopX family protein [Bacillus sp. mrc49]